MHERRCQTIRQQAPQPQLINHVEGSLPKEAMLHVVNAYTSHLAAAQMEQSQTRQLAAKLPRNCAYAHCDYMEKLPIPISNRETSDMSHGSTRKTISVFGMYLIECDAAGTRQTTAIILLSDVIELSAMFGNLCVRRALRHVKRLGSLDCLYLGLDAGNHFRSYELTCMSFYTGSRRRQARHAVSTTSSRSMENRWTMRRYSAPSGVGLMNSSWLMVRLQIPSMPSRRSWTRRPNENGSKIPPVCDSSLKFSSRVRSRTSRHWSWSSMTRLTITSLEPIVLAFEADRQCQVSRRHPELFV